MVKNEIQTSLKNDSKKDFARLSLNFQLVFVLHLLCNQINDLDPV